MLSRKVCLIFLRVFADNTFRVSVICGAVAQLARAPRLHRGGQGFESPQLHHSLKRVSKTISLHLEEAKNYFAVFGKIIKKDTCWLCK